LSCCCTDPSLSHLISPDLVVLSHPLSIPLFCSHDGISCTADTCNVETGACSNVMNFGFCCGNFLCQPGEYNACRDDCGPFDLTAPAVADMSTLSIAEGIMFNVEAVHASGLAVTGLTFYAYWTWPTMLPSLPSMCTRPPGGIATSRGTAGPGRRYFLARPSRRSRVRLF